METEIIVTKIHQVMTDSIGRDTPFIPIFPRACCALAYVFDGNLRYTSEKESTVIHPGEVVFIAPGSIDRAEAWECQRVSYITVDFYVLHTMFSLGTRAKLRDTDHVFTLFRQIEQCYLSGTYNRMMKCMELLYAIINTVIDNSVSASDSTLIHKHNRIAPAVSYIRSHYSDPHLTVAGLARNANMSEVNLNRLFHELYGMTAGAYIQNVRIRHAKTLLENSMTHIGEIAQAAGYNDVYTFSHAFKRETGSSPTDWRYRKK